MTPIGTRARLPQALVRLGLERPRRVLAFWLLLAGVATLGVQRVEIETSTDSVLDRADPAWAFYQESQARFGGDEIVAVVFEADQPFQRDALARVIRLSEALREAPGVRRVDSLATVPLVYTTPAGDVSLEPALPDATPPSAAELRRTADRVRGDRIAPRALVSEDGRTFAINLMLERGAEDRYGALLTELAGLSDAASLWVSGVPIFRQEATARTQSELLIFLPLTLGLIAGFLFLLFRSLQAVVIPLFSSGLGTWLMVASMGAAGVPLTISTVILPSVLLALGCAYAMHLLTAAAAAPSLQSLPEALLEVSLPIALSGLTTAVGFVAISFVRIDVVRDVGAFGSLGVLVLVAVTLSAGPAALRLWPMVARPARGQLWISGSLARNALRFVDRRRRAIIGAWLAALGLAAFGAAQLEVETDVIRWFSADHPIRTAYSAIRERLSGISPMNVVIEAEPGRGGVSSPRVIAALDGLSAYLGSLADVGKVISVADPLRQIHGGFTGDPSDPLPEDADLIEQYLLILESKEYMLDLITPDREAANVLVRVDDNGSGALLDLAEAAEDWWSRHGPEGFSARTTGIMYEFARAEDEIAYGQLRGLLFALCAVATLLILILGRPGLAAIALVPNVIPVVIAFGTMGVLGVALDAGTVLLGNLAIGIAVDDTIHVVAGYERERRAGASSRQAIGRTFERVLAALIFTTVTVVVGFLVLGLSGFTFTRHLGLLTSGIMVICLLADVLLLPALLLVGAGPGAGGQASRGVAGPLGPPPEIENPS